MTADVVRKLDPEAVVVAHQRLGAGQGLAGNGTGHADLAEACQRVRVDGVQFSEVRGPGCGRRPGAVAVVFVVGKQDIVEPGTDRLRHVFP